MKFDWISRSNRLWLVIGLTVLPLFLLTINDFGKQHQAALAEIEFEARLILKGVDYAEDSSVREIEMIFKAMAIADNMTRLAPQECEGLARRLRSVHGGLFNLGAVDLDGNVFCSATPMTQAVSVKDRAWFAEARLNPGITEGHFQIGRISGKPGITFGYAIPDEQGLP